MRREGTAAQSSLGPEAQAPRSASALPARCQLVWSRWAAESSERSLPTLPELRREQIRHFPRCRRETVRSEERKAQLLEAIQKRDAESAQRLLASDAGLGCTRNAQGVSALMLARYMNLRPVTEAILATHPGLDLFEAATFGDLARLQILLDNGKVEVNARSGDGGTALHFACFFAQPQCARELIQRGADLNAVAAAFGNVQPLHSAAAGRSIEIMRMLLEGGADPNQKQNQGWTVLHSAAQHGDVEMAGLLLRHGADVHSKSENGQTALDLARAGGHAEVASLLEKETQRAAAS